MGSVRAEETTLWLPGGLAFVLGTLWMWPRLKVLKLEARSGPWRELYLFVAVGTMIVAHEEALPGSRRPMQKGRKAGVVL